MGTTTEEPAYQHKLIERCGANHERESHNEIENGSKEIPPPIVMRPLERVNS
jgi:hypothetical protein